MILDAGPPYRRLASFYFFHYAALGALVPYWSLYMLGRGFNAVETGQVMALILAGRVVAPTIWGWVADLRGGSGPTLRLAALCSVLPFFFVPQTTSFFALASVMALFSLGFSGVIPQFEATTLNHLGDAPERYGLIRLWGSLGFVVAVSATGLALSVLPVMLLPWLVSLLLTAMLIAVWLTPQTRPSHTSEAGSLWQVLARPEVAALFLACFLVQASFGPYYVFFSVYLDSLGYQSASIGFFWALAVLAEILVFVYAGRLLRRTSLTSLFRFAVGFCALRWYLTAEAAGQPALLVVVQLTHMVTFGLYHVVALSLVHRHFTGTLQVRGQGLYSSLSFGAGGVAGSIASGYAWQHYGARYTFFLAATIAVFAFLITLFFMHRASVTGVGINIEKDH